MTDKGIVNTYNGACLYDSSPVNYHMLDILSPNWKSASKFTTAEYDSIYKKLDSINH